MNQDESLSTEEIVSTTNNLKKLSPGILPYDIFIEIARLVVTPTIELVPLRMVEGKIQVLLLEREIDNDIWKGKVHIPGTVILSTDEKGSFNDAFDRIFKNELGVSRSSNPAFIMFTFTRVKRGSEVSFIHWILLEDSTKGDFYDVDSLPENLVDHQKNYILDASRLFKELNKS